jgi:acylphosphatase
MPELLARRFVVQGRVQGVGFRYWTVQTVAALGAPLRGWVRNLHDGSVEILAIGSIDALARLEAACRVGPPHAQVTQFAVFAAADDGSIGFVQKPTR